MKDFYHKYLIYIFGIAPLRVLGGVGAAIKFIFKVNYIIFSLVYGIEKFHVGT